MPASTTTETPRRRRGDLSREQIVEAALAFLDRHGVEELSMRRLAAELGAGTMTLYGYFRDKDELLDAIFAAVGARRPLPELHGTWREQIRGLFLWFRDYLDEHPALIRMRLERPIVSGRAFGFTETALRVLQEAGFERDEAVRAFRTLFVHCYGFAAFNPPGRAGEAQREVRVAIASLPPEHYPVVTGSADALIEVMNPGRQFEYELDLLLDGLEARLQ